MTTRRSSSQLPHNAKRVMSSTRRNPILPRPQVRQFAKFTCRIPNLFDDNSRRVLHVPTNCGDFPGRNQFRLNLDEKSPNFAHSDASPPALRAQS